MARIAKSNKAATDTAAPAKVAKLDKAAKGKGKGKAADKAEPADKAPRAPRGQYANKAIRVTAEGKSQNYRGGAAVRRDVIVGYKNTNDALGAQYTIEGESEPRTITSADIAYLVERGTIELV